MWGSESCCAKDDITNVPEAWRHETVTLEDARAGVQPTSWDKPGTAAEASSAFDPGRKLPASDTSSRIHTAPTVSARSELSPERPPDATWPRHPSPLRLHGISPTACWEM